MKERGHLPRKIGSVEVMDARDILEMVD